MLCVDQAPIENGTMNIGTHFDYSNHIVFIGTLTNKHLAHIKRAPVIPEVNLLIQLFQTDLTFSNGEANLRLCLSPIITKLSEWDTNQNLGKGS